MGKTLKWVGVVIALVLVVFVGAAMMGGAAVRKGVEAYGPEYTGGSVTLGDVDFSVISGEARISELVIGNPEGFSSDYAFRLGELSVRLDPWSVFSDHIQVEEIRIDHPDLIVEIAGGGTNLNTIRRNAMQGEEVVEEDEEGPQITINDLFMTNGTVKIIGPIAAAQTPTVPLPDIHIEDIGADEEGGTGIGDAVSQVLAVVVPAALEAATKADLGGVAEGILEKGKSLTEGVTEGVGDTVKRGLGGLLKKKENDENQNNDE